MTRRHRSGEWLKGGRCKPFVDNVIPIGRWGPNANVGEALLMILPQIDAMKETHAKLPMPRFTLREIINAAAANVRENIDEERDDDDVS